MGESWHRRNGLSVFKGEKYPNEDFVLMMGDHLIDSALLEGLMNLKAPEGEIAVAVDPNRNCENI